LTVILIGGLILASATCLGTIQASSIPKPSVPEFTVTFADHSYDVAPSTISTTNPYNNKTTTTTIPGYHVQNYTIDLTIKNQPYPATIDGNTSYLLYDVRMKGNYTDAWIENNPDTYLPHQSSSEYTVLSFPATYRVADEGARYASDEVRSYSAGDKVDFQIRAILAYGYNFSLTASYPVYSYDYIYVALSDWSSTQTITIPENQTLVLSPGLTPTPSQEPQQIEQEIIIGAAIAAAVIIVGVGFLIYLVKRK
jgi:hypothetical protein